MRPSVKDKKKKKKKKKRRKKKEDNCVGESKRSDRGSLNVCVFTKMPS